VAPSRAETKASGGTQRDSCVGRVMRWWDDDERGETRRGQGRDSTERVQAAAAVCWVAVKARKLFRLHPEPRPKVELCIPKVNETTHESRILTNDNEPRMVRISVGDTFSFVCKRGRPGPRERPCSICIFSLRIKKNITDNTTQVRSVNHATRRGIGIDTSSKNLTHYLRLQDTHACPKPKATPKYITYATCTTHGKSGNAPRSTIKLELFDRHDLVETHIS
jgi:hypothetical protein